jgi:hypothetical protein
VSDGVTEKPRRNRRFAFLLGAGMLIVIPVSVYFGLKARVAPPEPAASLPALTDSSYGPVRIGMTLAELQRAIGPLADTTKLDRACDIVSAADAYRLPPGISITEVNGRVARIDIENDSIATDKGARVGDSEAKVKQLYGSGVIVEPHKYIDGHYLEIKFGNDSATAKGIVFETDGKKVTTFRAGFWEPVRWVEGCA